ncbi:growth arrest and DNA damage-inducible protein GADD45 gamma-like [Mytilus trossulus]|uniref:growth arrest and DNA damage-inducible protein GADD45 gamma-like n=1 Tax=Mytilus trossulus TaxID=6551 RepID=UPI003005AA35
MTFPENFGLDMDAQRNVNNIGMALKTILMKAKEDGRLVCGVYECAQILQEVPDDIALCLLPEVVDTDDVTANIQHKLVEAYCWENEIEVVKVDNFLKVGKMVRTDKTEEDNKDVGCVLIQNTKTDEKTDESANDFINNYYSMLANQTPVVTLPD